MPATTEERAKDQQPDSSDSESRDKNNAQQQQGSEKEQSQGHDQKDEKPMNPAKKARFILIGSVVAVILVIGIVLWLLHASTYEETDDAQVNGYINSVAARIEGTVTNVSVDNNHYVKAGESLVDLDPKDYQVAYDQANARLLQAKLSATAAQPNLSITRSSNRADTTSAAADVATAQAMFSAAEHDVAQAEARLRQSQATNVRAQNDLARYKQLVDKDEVSQEQYDQYLASARAQLATVEADQAAAASAKQTVLQRAATILQQQARLAQTKANGPRQEAIRSADIENQKAGVAVSQSALEQDQLNLAYTHIVAPTAGIVMLRSAEIGDRVSVGQRLMQIVQIDDLWIEANFKETQLRKMRPGQRVTVRVDSLKEDFEGTIDAMPAATGDRASLFPAENATGNFVKVVQRLPVRIHLNAGQRDLEKLRPGMSVEPKVSLD